MSSLVLLLVSFLAMTVAKDAMPISGEGMGRSPEDGHAYLDHTLRCYTKGSKEQFEVKWFFMDDSEETALANVGASLNPEEEGTYRCKIGDSYADFEVEEEVKSTSFLFRVDRFPKSYSVVEDDDLKVFCTVSNRSADINVKEDVLLKWYVYNVTGDDTTFHTTGGNCSEEVQGLLNWVEIVPKSEVEQVEPHIKLLKNSQGVENAILKIEDANATTDRRAFKCVAFHREARNNCSESAFFVRVRDRYAALWPFLGIVAEVIVVCVVIFICERRRASEESKDVADDEEDELTNGKTAFSGGQPGNSNVRQRGKQ